LSTSSLTAVAASGCTLVAWWQTSCVRGRAARHDCHHDTKVKPEAATAVIELLMMGGKTLETCWAVNKRQDKKLKNCCFWLVIYLNCKKVTIFGTGGLQWFLSNEINPLNAKLNPICHFLALLWAHPIFYVSRIRVNIYIFVSYLSNRNVAQIEFHAISHKRTIVKSIKCGQYDTTEDKLKHFSTCYLTFKNRGSYI
jgi:hypothetical protein